MKKGKQATTNFNTALIEAIDEALLSLGENSKEAIYYYLKTSYKIEPKEIPYRLEDFEVAMEKIFGIGTRSLEILFMKSLHGKVGGKCEVTTWCKWVVPELTFPEYVRLLRRSLEVEANEKELEVWVDAGQEQEQHI